MGEERCEEGEALNSQRSTGIEPLGEAVAGDEEGEGGDPNNGYL